MRADRLLHIMLLLQTSGGMTAKQLAGRLEVSERTIARDMEALGTAGVPVYAERGALGGWRLTEGYRADWSGLRKEELLALLASEPHRHLTDLGLGEAYEAAVLKVLASLSPALRRDADYMRQRVYVDAAGWHPSGEDVPWLPVLQEAVWEGRKLQLSYAAAGGSGGGGAAGQQEGGNAASGGESATGEGGRERIVSPLGLVLKGSLWYLVAARDDGELRSYRVSRVRDAVQLTEPAHRPDGFDLAAYWQRSVHRFRSELPRYPARALVHNSVGARLEQTRYVRVVAWLSCGEEAAAEQAAADRAAGRQRTGKMRGEEHASADWLEVELEFHTLQSACDIALGFGPALYVLEPAELRAALRTAARNIAALYAADASPS